jgi:arsenate reductase (thioredoxin)
MKNVLVLCTGNSCRSQMAEGWIRYYAGDEAEVYSAGIEAHGLNPNAVKVMNDALIDISAHKSKTTSDLPSIEFDYIITVCDNARENCPYFPGKAVRLHKSFPDPASFKGSEDEILQKFIEVRDMIEDYCFDFVHSYIRPLIPEDMDDFVRL